MNKEQTIRHLKLMQSGVRNAIRFTKNDKEISEEERKEDIEIYQDQLEAFNMAIKALEQQPSEDCVSRAEVIKTIENLYIPNETPSSHTEHEEYGTLIPKLGLLDEISDLPPVTPTFPKGATNGDIIRAMFPNAIIEINEIGSMVHVRYNNHTCWVNYELEWWDAPYKRGDSDGSN